MKRVFVATIVLACLLVPPIASRAQVPTVKLDGRGATIPLLHQFDTQYNSLCSELEAASANVNISSAKQNGCVFTLNQLAASDGLMLAFYKITSEQPLQRGQDVSIYGWDAKPGTAVFLDATIDGNQDPAKKLDVLGDFETFYLDDHTLVGWGLFRYIDEAGRIPEVCDVQINCAVGAGAIDTHLNVSFSLDRTTRLPGFHELNINQTISCSLQEDRGGVRSIQLTRLSLSPLGNILTVEEDVISHVETKLILEDAAGNRLPLLRGQQSSYGGSPQHPVHMSHNHLFVGLGDSPKLFVSPAELKDVKPTMLHIPLDATLPHTLTFVGGDTLTMLDLSVDKSGMTYRALGERGPFQTSIYDQKGKRRDLIIGSGESVVDRGTGIWTTRIRWAPQKGATKGERITQKMQNQLASIGFTNGEGWAPVEVAKVEIDLSGLH